MPLPLPKNITKEHILKGISEIDRGAYDPRYEAHKYDLEFNGKLYPPKHVVGLANQLANGGNLNALLFYPHEANRLLKQVGFVIKTRPSFDGGNAERDAVARRRLV